MQSEIKRTYKEVVVWAQRNYDDDICCQELTHKLQWRQYRASCEHDKHQAVTQAAQLLFLWLSTELHNATSQENHTLHGHRCESSLNTHTCASSTATLSLQNKKSRATSATVHTPCKPQWSFTTYQHNYELRGSFFKTSKLNNLGKNTVKCMQLKPPWFPKESIKTREDGSNPWSGQLDTWLTLVHVRTSVAQKLDHLLMPSSVASGLHHPFLSKRNMDTMSIHCTGETAAAAQGAPVPAAASVTAVNAALSLWTTRSQGVMLEGGRVTAHTARWESGRTEEKYQ
jgi:hypothetical protein